jgi:Protein of unknown function (DUF3318)
MIELANLFEHQDLERQRLLALSPLALRSHLTFSSHSLDELLKTTHTSPHQFIIHINWQRWHSFSLEQRDLLFWHEISRIQSRSVSQFNWEPVAIGIGFSVALIEVLAQNFWSLSFALMAVGLATHQLYQRRWGERSIRQLTAADYSAIALAIQSGYSFTQAYNSLYQALLRLSQQATQKSLRRKYKIRLSVLELLEAKQKPLQKDSHKYVNFLR